MKKVLSFVCALFAIGAVSAQTIVSTEVEKRNVLIEEYTGVGCGYCPDGHARANTVCQQYAGHAWAINIHQGGYASGSGYETQWGDGLAGQYNIQGYPCGTVNRCPSMQDRGQWASTAATVRTEDSPVNIAATASIDPMMRTLTVNVEMYYTGSQSVGSNFLNVVLLQDSVIGPQSNYGNYNSDYITSDGQYIHMHMLRDMLTGQWGEEITTITPGTLVQKTYTLSLPVAYGAVDVVFEHMNVIAFVTETHKKVLTANEAEMTILPGAWMSGFTVENNDCSLDYQPVVTVNNTFTEAVDSWSFMYDGAVYTYNKQVLPGASDTIHLPLYTIALSGTFVQNCAVTKSLSLVSLVKNGEAIDINAAPVSISFADFNIYTVAGPITARVGVDAWREEASVQLLNQSNCNVLWTENNFGPNVQYSAQYISQLPNASYYDIHFAPATAGLYIFRALDSYGDGWAMTNNNAKSGIWMSDGSGSQFLDLTWGYSGSPAFSEYDIYLNITNAGDGSHTMGINDIAANIEFSIYPNPVSDRLAVSCNEAVREISVIDVTGRSVMTLSNTNSVDVSSLAAGVYMVRIATESGVGIQKFVKE